MKAFTPYLCLLVAFTCASGIPPSKRNVCDWAGTSASIGHQYFGNSCPAKFTIAPNGIDCEDNALDLVSCASFCQIRTTFSYGREQRYTRVPLCRDGRPCQLSDTDHTIVGFNSLITTTSSTRQSIPECRAAGTLRTVRVEHIMPRNN